MIHARVSGGLHDFWTIETDHQRTNDIKPHERPHRNRPGFIARPLTRKSHSALIN